MTTTGLIVPISAKTGIALGRVWAKLHKLIPAVWDPVKATAPTASSMTSARPLSSPVTAPNVPVGAPNSAKVDTAKSTRAAWVNGWAG